MISTIWKPRTASPRGISARTAPGASDPLDAVVLSDLHLGAHNCETGPLLRLLERVERGALSTRRLVVNGDIFDTLDFRRMRPEHWQVLAALRRLEEKLEVIWLTGNHDGPSELVSLVLGVPVRDEWVLESGPRRILFLHGHVYDDFLYQHRTLTLLADWGYAALQRLDSSHELARRAKRVSKIFLRYRQKIVRGAVRQARACGCQVVICGHIHYAEVLEVEGIEYVNSGCWTEKPPTYLAVRDGRVEIRRCEEERERGADSLSAGHPLLGGVLRPAGETAL